MKICSSFFWFFFFFKIILSYVFILTLENISLHFICTFHFSFKVWFGIVDFWIMICLFFFFGFSYQITNSFYFISTMQKKASVSKFMLRSQSWFGYWRKTRWRKRTKWRKIGIWWNGNTFWNGPNEHMQPIEKFELILLTLHNKNILL